MRQHAPNARGQVTARHLLSQSSGLMTGASPPFTAGGSLQADPAGACYCYCGGGQAIGQCFDDATDQSECEGRNAVGAVPAAVVQMYCPEAALFLDCHDEPSASDCPGMLCPSSKPTVWYCAGSSHTACFSCAGLLVGEGDFRGYALNSTRTKLCSVGPTPAPLMATMQCFYSPEAYDVCTWVPRASCDYSPFFPRLSQVA